METVFVNFVQCVSDNRFWIMPLVFAALCGGIVNVFVTGFRGE